MRHRFEDSCNMDILNWKLYQKMNTIRTWSSRKEEFLSEITSWSSRKEEFLSEITSFLLLKFEYVNSLFPVQRFSCTFYDPTENWF